MTLSLFVLSLLSVTLTGALHAPATPFVKNVPVARRSLADGQSFSTGYFFDQLIDHTNPALGTFKQRYFFSDEFYKGQGAPIVLQTPGEQTADGFDADLTGASLQRAMMSAFGAAGIILEHRFWGDSSPYPELTAANLQYLTVNQAIDDFKYFAETVKLPTNVTSTTPDTTPWINLGCSYPGLLVAYTQEKYPQTFAAGYATSAPVQADGDFWEYWEPIEEGMPKNCSTDLAAAMAYMDNIFNTGTPDQITALKTAFGLESLNNDDFGAALTYPINTWQDLQPTDFARNGQSLFYSFCDAIETNADGTQNTNPNGVGLPTAFNNWASVFKQLGPDASCPDTGGACFSTYDYTQGQYTDITTDDTYMRAWMWLLCNELGWFQVGDPGNSSSIVSGQVTSAWSDRQCNHMFTKPDGSPGNYSTMNVINTVNNEFKGWNLVAPNLFVVNGEFDPWRSATLSSKQAPGFANTTTQDVVIVPGGHHCWDAYLENARVEPDILNIQSFGIETIFGWLKTWYEAHPSVKSYLVDVDTSVNGLKNEVGGVQGASGGPSTSNANVINTNTDSNSSSASSTDRWYYNHNISLASFILNGVLVSLLIATFAAWLKAKSKASKATNGGVLWTSRPANINTSRTTLVAGDDLGEYGTGGHAGGRGVYQTLKEQH